MEAIFLLAAKTYNAYREQRMALHMMLNYYYKGYGEVPKAFIWFRIRRKIVCQR